MTKVHGLQSFQLVWNVEIARPHTITAVRKAGVFNDRFDIIVDDEILLEKRVGLGNLIGQDVIRIDGEPIVVSWKWGALSGSPEAITLTHNGREIAAYYPDGSAPILDPAQAPPDTTVQLPPAGQDQPTLEQVLQASNRAKLEKQLKSGASWFYWIAGLSLINSLMFWFGGSTRFLTGLAFTQVIDVFTQVLATEVGLDANGWVQIVTLLLDIIVGVIFVACGYFAGRGYRWVFIGGMVLYAVDGAISLAFSDIASAGFHLFALFGLYSGLTALKQLSKTEGS